jgi:hypothetical protein
MLDFCEIQFKKKKQELGLIEVALEWFKKNPHRFGQGFFNSRGSSCIPKQPDKPLNNRNSLVKVGCRTKFEIKTTLKLY